METEDAAPCNHPGAPPDTIVDRVSKVIASLANDAGYLASKGLTTREFEHAFPAAIQKLRGSDSASNADRRAFLAKLFDEMQTQGRISNIELPKYGVDTIYRLVVPGVGNVAIIQKGCPDGPHSSVKWSRPEWATEAYLWWVCSSLRHEPGTHIWKGVCRLRQRFFSDAPDTIDGIIFHNELCGTPSRPCPKTSNLIQIDGKPVPPPCLYVMPQHRDGTDEWNWGGNREILFPQVLFSTFGIPSSQSSSFTGHVGFQKHGADIRTVISCHFGPGRSTSYRS